MILKSKYLILINCHSQEFTHVVSLLNKIGLYFCHKGKTSTLSFYEIRLCNMFRKIKIIIHGCQFYFIEIAEYLISLQKYFSFPNFETEEFKFLPNYPAKIEKINLRFICNSDVMFWLLESSEDVLNFLK